MSEKRKIIIFLSITFVFSFILEFYVLFKGGLQELGNLRSVIIPALMWIPGVACLLVRGITKDWKDLGLKLGKIKYHIIALFAPLIISLFSFYICSLLDIRILKLFDGMPLDKILLKLMTILGFGIFCALGEELGWRGFLVPKIYKTNFKHPTLYSGLIWAAWHIPLVAFGGYYTGLSPLVVCILYTGLILIINFFINWLRLLSGSLLVAVLAHAFYNYFFQSFWFGLLFREPGKNEHLWNILGGDVGLIGTTMFVLLSFTLWKQKPIKEVLDGR